MGLGLSQPHALSCLLQTRSQELSAILTFFWQDWGWGTGLQTLNLRTLQGLQIQSPDHQKHTGIGAEVVAPSQRTGPRSVVCTEV